MADFEKAKKKRTLKIKHISELIENLKKFDSGDKSIQFFEQKIIQINQTWDSILKTTDEMMDNDNYNNSEQQELSEIQDIYDDAIIQIEEKRAAISTKRSIELPPLNIPPFDGNFINWRSFYDIFERAIVEDTSISNSEKLQFLKTLVRGEASQMISHLQITEENFDTAWTLLKNRYNNERRLIESYVKTLINQPHIKNDTPKALREIHDTTMECLKAIENLGVKTDQADFLLNVIILQKLDPETIRLYETSIGEPRKMQKFDNLLSIIEKRFQTLEFINNNN